MLLAAVLLQRVGLLEQGSNPRHLVQGKYPLTV
jgi:hypothetical protein